MARKKTTPVSQGSTDLAEAVASFYDDPLGFVFFVFPWGERGTELAGEDGPDQWQAEFLDRLGREVRRRGSGAVSDALRMAVSSGHGVGKSTLVSWVILWFISTRPTPQIVVTANTKTQLTTKTWRELSRWHKLSINSEWFQWTATKFYLKESPEDWFAIAQPWSKESTEGFAGTHARDVLMIFDEASGIDDSVWEVVKGAMSTVGAMWLCFGNPTKNTGMFRECWRRFRRRWITFKVDSREAKQANQTEIEKDIEDYGEDSDFVRVRWRGEFPRAASSQLIPEDHVVEAQRRYKRRMNELREMGFGHNGGPPLEETDHWGDRHAAKIMSVDVARFGDDQSVIGIRQGSMFRIVARYRELDTEQMAYRVGEWIDQEKPDGVFIDANGIGAGVVDKLEHLGYEVESHFGQSKATNEHRYYNKRIEAWDAMKLWIKNEACLPDDGQLKDDLIGPEYGFDGKGRMQLETKDDMKSRGLPSPDAADCLSMTFSMPVAKRIPASQMTRSSSQRKYGSGSWMAF